MFKKRLVKTLVSIGMAVVLATTPMSSSDLNITAIAAEADSNGFVIEDGVLTSYQGNGGTVEIPNTVTKIGTGAFSGCTQITSVTIPGSVTVIDERAFYGCSGLQSVTFTSGLKSIEKWAFYGCSSLTGIELPEGLERIAGLAFYNCSSLKGVIIPQSVSEIGASAFSAKSTFDQINLQKEFTKNGLTGKSALNTYQQGSVQSQSIVKKYNNLNILSGSAISTNENLYLDVLGNEFTIRSSSGSYAKVKGIHVVEGNLNVKFSSVEIGGSTVTFEIPQLKEEESYTIDLEDGTKEIVIRNRDKNTGYYCSVKAEKPVSITVDYNGVMNTQTKDGEAVCQTISYAKNTLNWVGTDIIGIDTGFKVGEADGKIQISSDNNVQIDLNLSDWLNELDFEDIKTEDGIAVVSCDKKETSEKDVYIVSDSQGNEIAKKEMGFCVKFYPLNNTKIEDVKNVASGSAITEPAEPKREGYEFAGWYTSCDCNEDEKWNFNEDKVTKNTSLWAKWVEIPNKTVQPPQETTPVVTPTQKPDTTITKPSKPSKVTLKNSAKETIKVTWKKVSKATGYKVVYSTNKKFSKSKTKTVTVKNAKNSVTIKKLKKGKTYYVKVRAYKKDGTKTVYGKYSAVKKLKIK